MTSPSRRHTLTWRVLRDPPHPGATNMALDHALAAELGHREAVLRLYSWARPTISFGRNEPALDLYRREAIPPGVDTVRRPTGGRAVLHDAEVTYAVVGPIQALGGARQAYRDINRALCAALQSLGAAVSLSDAADTLSLDAGPCFQSPAEGEVTAGGRKLVGSAQARVAGALLQHGSIILDGDQSLLDRLSRKGGTEHPRPATLTGLVAGASAAAVADAVIAGMTGTFGGDWNVSDYRPAELATATRLEAERYARDDWTWRR